MPDGCLRFSEAFDSAGVFAVDVGVDEDAVDDDAFWLCGIVLCCFVGELWADGGAFWGELIEDVGA